MRFRGVFFRTSRTRAHSRVYVFLHTNGAPRIRIISMCIATVIIIIWYYYNYRIYPGDPPPNPVREYSETNETRFKHELDIYNIILLSCYLQFEYDLRRSIVPTGYNNYTKYRVVYCTRATVRQNLLLPRPSRFADVLLLGAPSKLNDNDDDDDNIKP